MKPVNCKTIRVEGFLPPSLLNWGSCWSSVDNGSVVVHLLSRISVCSGSYRRFLFLRVVCCFLFVLLSCFLPSCSLHSSLLSGRFEVQGITIDNWLSQYLSTWPPLQGPTRWLWLIALQQLEGLSLSSPLRLPLQPPTHKATRRSPRCKKHKLLAKNNVLKFRPRP